MIEIVSKRDGPRPADARMRGFLEQNRATITRIADHLSAGAYSARKAQKQPRQAQGLIIHAGSGTHPGEDMAAPAVRISLNGRVSLIDGNSGYQLHHLGNLITRDGTETFVLATAANGFIAPVQEDIASSLMDIDGLRLTDGLGENELVAEISTQLGLG